MRAFVFRQRGLTTARLLVVASLLLALLYPGPVSCRRYWGADCSQQITTLADGCKSELANVMRIRNLTNSNLFGPAAPPPPPAVVSQYAARLDRLRPGKACCKAACQFTAALCGCTKGRPVESDRGGLAQFYTEYTLSCAQKCTFNSIHDGTGSCPASIDPVAAQKNCPA